MMCLLANVSVTNALHSMMKLSFFLIHIYRKEIKKYENKNAIIRPVLMSYDA